jgi:hypothetical protein
MKSLNIYPIVRSIPNTYFEALLSLDLPKEESDIIRSFKKAQDKYRLLTKRKHAYFWTIYAKYFPMEELEYPETVTLFRHNIISTNTKKKEPYTIWD